MRPNRVACPIQRRVSALFGTGFWISPEGKVHKLAFGENHADLEKSVKDKGWIQIRQYQGGTRSGDRDDIVAALPNTRRINLTRVQDASEKHNVKANQVGLVFKDGPSGVYMVPWSVFLAADRPMEIVKFAREVA